MGLIEGVMSLLFGGGRNAVAETVEVFRENAEAAAMRDASRAEAALVQYAAEFAHPRKHWFDAIIDGLNRVPRPAMALGTIGLVVAAMVDPIWFGERMTGLALVPEPLWWLLGAIVSFYFGARHQVKSQDFQRSITDTLARAPKVAAGINALRALEAGAGTQAETAEPMRDTAEPSRNTPANAALQDWRTANG